MSVKTTEEYFALLEKSGVLADDQLGKASALASETPDVREFARLCVTRKWLTDWQARFLMTGRHRLKVGHYRLLDHLPKQDIGDRFRALHHQLDRNVDVWLLPKSAEQNKPLVQQFLQQAAVVAELDHPNLLHVYDIDKDSDRYFLVFESEKGRALSNIPEKSVDSAGVAKIVLQVLEGTRHAHDHNVLHGKLEAAHIRMDEKGGVKVHGFGITKLLDKMIDPDSEPDEFAIASDPSDDIAALGRLAKALFQRQVGKPLNNADVALFALFGKLEQTSDTTNNQTNALIGELGDWLKANPSKTKPTELKRPAKIPTTKKPAKAVPAQQTDSLGKQLWIGIAVSLVLLSGLGIWYLAGGFSQKTVTENLNDSSKPTLDSANIGELPKIAESKRSANGNISKANSPKADSAMPPKTESTTSPPLNANDTAVKSGKSDAAITLENKQEATAKKTATTAALAAPKSSPDASHSPLAEVNTIQNSDSKAQLEHPFAIEFNLDSLMENTHANLLADSKKLDLNNPTLRNGFLGYRGPDVYIAFKKPSAHPATAGVANAFNGGFRFRIMEANSGDKAYALNMFRLEPVNLMEPGISGEVVVPLQQINLQKLANAHVRIVIRDNGSFYISQPSDNLAKGESGVHQTIINVDAKEQRWKSYDPTSGELDNFSGIAAEPKLTKIDFAGFLLYGERSDKGGGGTNFGSLGLQAFRMPQGSQAISNPQSDPDTPLSTEPPDSIVMDKAEGLPLVSWEKAEELMDSEAVVYGKIVSIGSSRSGKTRYLNFIKDDFAKFKIVVRQRDLEISEEALKEKFLDKHICIRGEITTFDTKPQILLTELDRIITVEALPDSDTQLVGNSPSTVNKIASTGMFAGMSGGVSIPELTKDDTNFEPVLLGPVKIGDDPLGLFLTVPEEASSRPLFFEIERDKTGKRWEISYAATAREAENKKLVAEIQLKENQLFFNWVAQSSYDANLNFLQNCLLEIKAPDESKTILLRKPQRVAPIHLDEKRANSKLKLGVKYLPKPESIFVEFLSLPKAEFETQVSDTGMTANEARPEAVLYFDRLPENQFFRLAHTVSISKTIKIDSALQINSPGKPAVFNKRNVRDLKQNLAKLQNQINQANQVAINYDPPYGQKTKHKDRLEELSKQLDMVNAQVLAFGTALPTAERLLTQKLKYRVYFTIGELQFDLLNSNLEAGPVKEE